MQHPSVQSGTCHCTRQVSRSMWVRSKKQKRKGYRRAALEKDRLGYAARTRRTSLAPLHCPATLGAAMTMCFHALAHAKCVPLPFVEDCPVLPSLLGEYLPRYCGLLIPKREAPPLQAMTSEGDRPGLDAPACRDWPPRPPAQKPVAILSLRLRFFLQTLALLVFVWPFSQCKTIFLVFFFILVFL